MEFPTVRALVAEVVDATVREPEQLPQILLSTWSMRSMTSRKRVHLDYLLVESMAT